MRSDYSEVTTYQPRKVGRAGHPFRFPKNFLTSE